jgi:DNA end-binding protein Ku
VPLSEIVKGYEFEKGRYVVMDEDDIQKVRVESTRVIDLAQFTDVTSIDPIYVDRRLLPCTGRLGGRGRVRRDARRDGGEGRDRQGRALRPRVPGGGEAAEEGLVMYTLHHDAEIRSIDEIEELNSVPSKAKPQEMKLAKQIVATFDSELNLKDYKDEYKRRPAQDHRREDRRRGNRRDRTSRAAEGRRSDGSAAQEPQCGQHREEEAGEGRAQESQSQGHG